MFKLNATTGEITFPDGFVIGPPYDDDRYLEYASFVQSGGTAEVVFTQPIAPVPESVSRFQARAALWQMGFLDEVEDYMALETTDMMAKLAWRDAQDFRIDSVFVLTIAPLLGFSDAQLADMFRFASTITG